MEANNDLSAAAGLLGVDIPGRADIERTLRETCYAAILPNAQVGVDDDFFALGGDSVMLIRLVTMAQQTFAVEIDAFGFFEQTTLSALAAAVEQELRAAAEARIAAVLASLESMSDAEVAALLGEGDR